MTEGEMQELRWLVVWWKRDQKRKRHLERAAASCQGKDKFLSYEQANKTISLRLRQFSHAYRCTVCGSWHVGGRRMERNRRLLIAEKSGKFK